MRNLHRLRTEQGSAPVEFLLVSLLTVTLVLGVIQLAIALHVRTVLIDAAAEGARYAALYGADHHAGLQRAQAVIETALSAAFAEDLSITENTVEDINLIEVYVRAPLPLFGFLGPQVMEVTGSAVVE